MTDAYLLNNAPCGYLAIRESGDITIANDTLNAILGYQRGELVGRNIEEIFTLASKVFYSTHLFPTLKLQHRADEIFISLKGKENESIPVLTNAVLRQDGDFLNIHFVFIPIRQRQKHENAILQAKAEAEKMLKENEYLEGLKSSLESKTLELDRQYRKLFNITENLLQFSKIVSHDLQEPLRKIQLFGDILSTNQQGSLDEKSLLAITRINKAAERMRHLTSGLLQFVNLDTENLVTQVNITEIIQRAYSKAVEKRSVPDAQLNCSSLPTIEGYASQLGLLFYHLIDNSLQFRDPSRPLVISVTSTFIEENDFKISDNYRFSRHVRIVFTDNGSGFDGKYKDQIFQLLTKLDPSLGGLGIGLATIKKVVINHSGEIHVVSKQGQGTSFTITLPTQQ